MIGCFTNSWWKTRKLIVQRQWLIFVVVVWIYCNTGLLVETAFNVGRSSQLASLTAAFSAVASSPLRFLTTSAGGLALVTTGMYCVGRYVSDIGVRRDVIKVPVQTLVVQATPTAMEAEVAAAGAVGASLPAF